MKINVPLTPDFAFFSFAIGTAQICSILLGTISKDRGLTSYIFLVIIPYIYIVFIRTYFIKKDFMLNEVILHINFKCITNNNLCGKIIKKSYINLYDGYSDTKRYYVSSRFVSKNLKYYGVSLPYLSNDFEISDYELWKQIKIGRYYRLKYYKHDKSRIILQIKEIQYPDELNKWYIHRLNKYFINDISNLIIKYL